MRQCRTGMRRVVSGDTDDDVLASATAHAAEAHGMQTVSDDVLTAIRANITEQ